MSLIVTLLPGEVQSIVMSICFFVCLLSVHVARGRGSVLLWRRWDIRHVYCRFYAWRYVFMPWGQWAESSKTLCLEQFARWRYQLNVGQLQCLVEFVMQHALVKSDIYHW